MLNCCFTEEVENCRENNRIARARRFQGHITAGMLCGADEELIDLSENALLKLNFNRC